MSTLKKFNLQGEEIGSVEVPQELMEATCSPQLLKEYIVAYRHNQRQWSASTKRRSERSHSTQKPHPQKGTGRARQGSLAATQYKGGGRPFGPKPKFDVNIKINKEEKRQVMRTLLAQKLQKGEIKLIESMSMSAPKTRTLDGFVQKVTGNRRVLFVGGQVNLELEDSAFDQERVELDAFIKSLRNLESSTFTWITCLNGYDMAVSREVVMTEEVFNTVATWLG